jgi:hypothetical protein
MPTPPPPRPNGGVRPGSGRKPDEARRLLDSVLYRVVTEAEIEGIVRATLDLAKGGDIKAAALIFDRLAGKAADPNAAELLKIRREELAMAKEKHKADMAITAAELAAMEALNHGAGDEGPASASGAGGPRILVEDDPAPTPEATPGPS